MGAKYSQPFDLKFTDRDNEDKPVLMGCYGIGLSRLVGAIVEASHDDKGIIWPKTVSPFSVHLLQIENSSANSNQARKVRKAAEELYDNLIKENIEVLYDDRQNKSAGEKFVESDLIGIPYRVVVSEKTLEKKSVEVKERGNNEMKMVKIKSLLKILNSKS